MEQLHHSRTTAPVIDMNVESGFPGFVTSFGLSGFLFVFFFKGFQGNTKAGRMLQALRTKYIDMLPPVKSGGAALIRLLLIFPILFLAAMLGPVIALKAIFGPAVFGSATGFFHVLIQSQEGGPVIGISIVISAALFRHL